MTSQMQNVNEKWKENELHCKAENYLHISPQTIRNWDDSQDAQNSAQKRQRLNDHNEHDSNLSMREMKTHSTKVCSVHACLYIKLVSSIYVYIFICIYVCMYTCSETSTREIDHNGREPESSNICICICIYICINVYICMPSWSQVGTKNRTKSVPRAIQNAIIFW